MPKSFNPFDLIGQKWMLISAGTEDKWNTMTASWGAVGVMWGKPSATCYIRKSRFTKEFVDAGGIHLTVLKDGHRDALNKMGSKSGRDMDKMHERPYPGIRRGQSTFEEAELVLICRKRGVTDIAPDDSSGSAGQVVRRSRLPHHVYRRDRSRLRELSFANRSVNRFLQIFHQFLTESVYI
ncbi:MAG: hypothetical protein ACLT4C_06305 [Butyricicoccus sp.]